MVDGSNPSGCNRGEDQISLKETLGTIRGFFVCRMMSRFGYDVRKDIRKTNHNGGIRIWYVGLGGESIDKTDDDGYIFSTTENTTIKTDPNLCY